MTSLALNNWAQILHLTQAMMCYVQPLHVSYSMLDI